jgi:hypothetical protein
MSCGHDGWVRGCPECEREAALAGELIEPAEAREEPLGQLALRLFGDLIDPAERERLLREDDAR